MGSADGSAGIDAESISCGSYDGVGHASLTFTHSCPATSHHPIMMTSSAAAVGGMTSSTGMGDTQSTLNMTSSNQRSRQLTRSSRAEEIPDIYWEQAARELDFCTCRKCQVHMNRINVT